MWNAVWNDATGPSRATRRPRAPCRPSPGFGGEAIGDTVDGILRLVHVVEHEVLGLHDPPLAGRAFDARERHLHLPLRVRDQLTTALRPFPVGANGAASMKRSVDEAGGRCQWRTRRR